jgi:hypothetical protein
MPQIFALTWIDVLIAMIPFVAIYIHHFFGSLNIHKFFKFLLHPVTLLSSFVLIVVYISHF